MGVRKRSAPGHVGHREVKATNREPDWRIWGCVRDLVRLFYGAPRSEGRKEEKISAVEREILTRPSKNKVELEVSDTNDKGVVYINLKIRKLGE